MQPKFKEGQLVVATDRGLLKQACISKPSNQDNLMQKPFPFLFEPDSEGTEEFVEGAARHPDGWVVPVKGLKPVVHYDKTRPVYIKLGSLASVYALDHPRLGEQDVYTSTVIRYDEATGVFETRNTVYFPKEG